MNKFIFREYDIRGNVPKDINKEVAYNIGAAYGTFHSGKRIVVGMDGRLSSPELTDALINGLVDVGKDVIDVGLVPTPVFYFAIAHYGYDGGIMVTGSHNPKDTNGFKLQKEGALPIFGENGIYDIRDIVLNERYKKSKTTGKITKKDVVEDYVNYVAKKARLKRKLKIIIDNGNGACGIIPEMVFKRLGCSVITLNAKIDGNFPKHVPDPHEQSTLKELQDRVVKEKADVGIAFDGDGDRVGVVDERGQVVPGDFVLLILARKALAQKKGKVVVEVRASNALLDDIKSHGGDYIMSKAGHAYVLQKIFDEKAVFGGELTGHMYFPLEYYDYDDGVFIGVKLLELISSLDKLSKYVDSLPRQLSSPELFIDSTDEEKFKIVEKFQDYLKKNKYDILDIDGARINFEHGWALARASNTSPYIKCRFEADNEKNLEKIKKETLEILRKCGADVSKTRFTN